jgi:hypothetical protein
MSNSLRIPTCWLSVVNWLPTAHVTNNIKVAHAVCRYAFGLSERKQLRMPSCNECHHQIERKILRGIQVVTMYKNITPMNIALFHLEFYILERLYEGIQCHLMDVMIHFAEHSVL